MTPEQKSKAYDEALEKAKQIIVEYDYDEHNNVFMEIFPELKESEDEKIRKELIEHVKDQQSSFISAPDCRDKYEEEENNKYNAWLDWLEKQEGCECIKKDWLEHIKQSWYKEGFIDGKYSDGTSKEWTKNDAATLKELIDFLENGTAKLQHDLTRYANWLKIQLTPIKKQGNPTDINPSEFDLRLNKLLKQFETLPKEELANSLSFYLNVVQNDGTYKPDEKQGEQKSAEWSEEDEKRVHRISNFIWKNRKGDTDEIYQQEQDVNWLKSLKNKVQPQPKHEWSEEDKKMIGRIRSIVEKYAFSQSAVDVNGDLCEKEYIDTDNWLKSLKDRVRPKQEWSEEDETKMRAALAFIKSEFPKKGNEEIMEDTIEWLKSLRPQQKHEWSEEDEKNLRRAIRTTKVVYPEAADWLKSIGNRITWKPSKGQLECLGYAIDKAEKDYSPLANNRVYLTLKSLKEQLKKLTE